MIRVLDMTLTVNDAADGFLSTVADIAVIDVLPLENVSIMVNKVGDVALLDLATVTVNVDTIIRALVAGETPEISFVDGAAEDEGNITEDAEAGTIVIAFKTGVTTVADVETLLGTSTLVSVLTTGTGATALVTVDDEFASTPLALGAATFTIDVEKSPDGINWSTVGTVDEADFPDGNNVSSELTLSDSNGMPTTARQIRATLSALSGASLFTITAAGVQR